jgi:hypothetical protein
MRLTETNRDYRTPLGRRDIHCHGARGKTMRKTLAVMIFLLLAACASSGQSSHDFGGTFVGVSGGGQTP